MLFGRILLDNEHVRVTVGLLGGIEVILKSRGLKQRVVREERAYFHRLIEVLKNGGVPIQPGNPIFEYVVDEFAMAIFSGEVTCSAYFLMETPENRAIHCCPVN